MLLVKDRLTSILHQAGIVLRFHVQVCGGSYKKTRFLVMKGGLSVVLFYPLNVLIRRTSPVSAHTPTARRLIRAR